MHNDGKNLAVPIMAEWLVKMVKVAEMAKLSSLIREKTICFLLIGNLYRLFAQNRKKHELMI